jgi:hypothetical protein
MGRKGGGGAAAEDVDDHPIKFISAQPSESDWSHPATDLEAAEAAEAAEDEDDDLMRGRVVV